jgi:hypothetical protein
MVRRGRAVSDQSCHPVNLELRQHPATRLPAVVRQTVRVSGCREHGVGLRFLLRAPWHAAERPASSPDIGAAARHRS